MFEVNGRMIGEDYLCFIVAEAGLAHGGDIQKAYRLIDMAIQGGIDAVKFQIYKTDELWSRERAPEWHDRFAKKELPYEAFKGLKEYAEKSGIVWFATPHTESAFEYLESINASLYKIGSGEHDDRFIGRIFDTGKPLIISTGLRTHSEVMNLIDSHGSSRTAFLHCVTSYPAIESLLNLRAINAMKRYAAASRSIIGYSDHTTGVKACEVAVALGAKVIEKHICLPESEGQDTTVSLKSVDDIKGFVGKIRKVESIMGDSFRYYSPEEKVNERWALKNQTDGRRPVL